MDIVCFLHCMYCMKPCKFRLLLDLSSTSTEYMHRKHRH